MTLSSLIINTKLVLVLLILFFCNSFICSQINIPFKVFYHDKSDNNLMYKDLNLFFDSVRTNDITNQVLLNGEIFEMNNISLAVEKDTTLNIDLLIYYKGHNYNFKNISIPLISITDDTISLINFVLVNNDTSIYRKEYSIVTIDNSAIGLAITNLFFYFKGFIPNIIIAEYGDIRINDPKENWWNKKSRY